MRSKLQILLDEFINLHPKYIDLSLGRLEKLLKKLGNPHFDLPKTIHIAGTNGKGSIQSYIRKILVTNGYSCDSYISPHLTRFNERIILNNKEVSTRKLFSTLQYVKKINSNKPITFFEITTAAAFILFKNSKSDFLILETGLGGRLDATNIIPKKFCSIITPISYDHEEYLGNTIKKITREKLGIIKKSEFVFISKQNNEVKKYIKKKLSNLKNIYYYGKDYRVGKINKKNFEFIYNKKKILITKPRLQGLHQIENSSLAIAFSKFIQEKNIKLNFNKTAKAIYNTEWPGRLEIIKYKNKKIILDGSHNIDGAKKLNKFLIENKLNPIVLFGMLNNKKINSFLKIISNKIKKILAIKIPNEKNAFMPNEIYKCCDLLAINCEEVRNLNHAIKYINSSREKLFLITGSLYLVGSLRNKFL